MSIEESAAPDQVERGAVESPLTPVAWSYRQIDDELSLVDVWRFLVRYRYLILVTVVLTTGLALARALLMTPIYRAEVLLAPVMDEQAQGGLAAALTGQLGGLASLAGINVQTGGDVEEALALLGSRAFTVRFFKDENLLPVFFADRWDGRNQRWILEEGERAPTLWSAYNYFDREVRSISEDSDTGLVTLAIEWKDRSLAAQWANLLVERVNQRLREREIVEAEQSLDYLNEEIKKTSIVELQQAIYRLIENQVNRVMLANVRTEYAFKVIDPAVQPDEGHYVRPKTTLMIVLGVMFGFFLAMCIAFFHHLALRARGEPHD